MSTVKVDRILEVAALQEACLDPSISSLSQGANATTSPKLLYTHALAGQLGLSRFAVQDHLELLASSACSYDRTRRASIERQTA